MYRSIASDSDREIFQADIKALETWSTKWQLPFNRGKCKLMHLGSANQGLRYQMAEVELVAVKEKDLGVINDDTLKFHEQTACGGGTCQQDPGTDQAHICSP